MTSGMNDSRATWLTALVVLAGALVATVLATVLISPVLLASLQGMGATATLAGVTTRTLQIVAIVVTGVVLRQTGGGGRIAWGIPARDRLWPRVMLGVGYGWLSLGAVCALVYLSEVRILRPGLSLEPVFWLRVITGALIAAVSVSLLEELWFRGGLFAMLSRLRGLSWAVTGSAVLYAGTHFLDVPDDGKNIPVSVLGSLEVLHIAVLSVFQIKNLDSFVALLVAGLMLALVRTRHGDAAVCIGIHLGWVFVIKVFKKATVMAPDLPGQRLVGNYDGVIGWLAAACLAVMLILIWRFMRPVDSKQSGARPATGSVK